MVVPAVPASTTALITGANKGIGYATARLLGAQEIRVLVGARDTERGGAAERALRSDGADAKFVRLDVTDADSIVRVAALIETEYGLLDILVNNAGITGTAVDHTPSRTTVDTLREVYETNLFGVVAVTNAMLPLLCRSPTPRIVNVSSEVGSITATTDPHSPLRTVTAIPYPSSKTALNMVAAMYAKELHDTAFKVNAANPGWCATDLSLHQGPRTAEQGADVVVELATLPDDGPSGILWGPPSYGPDDSVRLPW